MISKKLAIVTFNRQMMRTEKKMIIMINLVAAVEMMKAIKRWIIMIKKIINVKIKRLKLNENNISPLKKKGSNDKK